MSRNSISYATTGLAAWLGLFLCAMVAWLTPLNELQKGILDLFGFSHDIYLRLVTNFQNLAPEYWLRRGLLDIQPLPSKML
jgi:hypothetical protein